jgi:hypothetical protein
MVTSSATGVYDVTLEPHECGSNFPLYTPVTGQVSLDGTVEVREKQFPNSSFI